MLSAQVVIGHCATVHIVTEGVPEGSGEEDKKEGMSLFRFF